ncbi:MAG TPA: hypothetical protein VNZ57_05295, partial [Longimicrobiales bacterium]|nr:hypothetical protein [Longimicrobiales bacterium]
MYFDEMDGFAPFSRHIFPRAKQRYFRDVSAEAAAGPARRITHIQPAPARPDEPRHPPSGNDGTVAHEYGNAVR